jgi:phenylalanyl-tRNA synthetase beta chain
MRLPVSWVAEHCDLPAGLSPRELADALVRVGLEVESVEDVAAGLTGPLVVGRVLDFADERHSNGRTIRWCSVDVGETSPRGIVCGAHNFVAGDAVVVALPGAVLPGGFAISSRPTYGHVSDGMICSLRELGLGEDHSGIIVLGADDLAGAALGNDARQVLGLPDAVMDIAVTPDRGYCLSVRGIAREAAQALGVAFRDPADRQVSEAGGGWPVRVEDPSGCDRFVARTVEGLDPSRQSPLWLRRRLWLSGMRPISLSVDVTNYVMLELGQPIHGYDRNRLSGPIVVRRARDGETVETLDGTVRSLDPDDLVIADDSGVIGVAGVMGGTSTELGPSSTDVVVEAAHFEPVVVARGARRHRLPSEASRRFERGVDDDLPPAAADRVVELLVALGGGRAAPTATDVDDRVPRTPILLDLAHPGKVAGLDLAAAEVVDRLRVIGCTVEPAAPGSAHVGVPGWRPDLLAPADLAEEVIRLHGYHLIPSVLPPVRPGTRRPLPFRDVQRVSRALAGTGFVEVRAYPFVGEAAFDALGIEPTDPRRVSLRLANPLSEGEPLLRTTLLPGLLGIARRNIGRGFGDLALYETGRVFLPSGPDGTRPHAPRPGVDARPSDLELAALDAALPDQPVHVAVVLTGAVEPAGWWGSGRPASWADAVAAVRTIASAVSTPIRLRAGHTAPWHPGRCAEVVVDASAGYVVAGHAGELHPRACAELGLPQRTCAAELVLQVLVDHATELVSAPHVSTFPVATQDVAVVVDQAVPAADVAQALVEGAGPLLESLRMFDLFTGEQVGVGRKSLAYTLRFRAPDRTLTAEEVGQARTAAVDEAARRVGAVLRG